MKIANWNIERPHKNSRKNPYIVRQLLQSRADIIILTETHTAVSLKPEYVGFHTLPSPRKPRDGEAVAAIWLRQSGFQVIQSIPTSDAREAICLELISPIGALIVYASIIPYHGAKGSDGQSGRWVEHKRAIDWHRQDWMNLRAQFPHHELITAGDYNQHRDGVGKYGNREIRNLLSEALIAANLICVTEEDFVANGKLSRHVIDHICMTPILAAEVTDVDAWEGNLEGRHLSDHSGISVSIASIF